MIGRMGVPVALWETSDLHFAGFKSALGASIAHCEFYNREKEQQTFCETHKVGDSTANQQLSSVTMATAHVVSLQVCRTAGFAASMKALYMRGTEGLHCLFGMVVWLATITHLFCLFSGNEEADLPVLALVSKVHRHTGRNVAMNWQRDDCYQAFYALLDVG